MTDKEPDPEISVTDWMFMARSQQAQADWLTVQCPDGGVKSTTEMTREEMVHVMADMHQMARVYQELWRAAKARNRALAGEVEALRAVIEAVLQVWKEPD